MSISIAMCTYNGARYLSEQLQSFAAQQRLPDELVVCDDGSTDGSIALIEDFAATAAFPVRLVRNPHNLGYSRNFAQALRLCTGSLIALADQDDVWYPQKLRVLEELLLQHPGAEAVFSDGDIVDEQTQPTGRTLWQSFRFSPPAQRHFTAENTAASGAAASGAAASDAAAELLRRNVVTGMTLMVRSSARELLESTPASWIHDGWLAFLVVLRSRLLACPERLVGYRVHGTQQVGTPMTTAAKIGALRTGGVAQYASRVRALNLEEYRRSERQFADLLHFLEQHGQGSPELRAAVRDRQLHAARGVRLLGQSRLRRLTVLSSPDSYGRYARYSPNGLRGLVRDLLV